MRACSGCRSLISLRCVFWFAGSDTGGCQSPAPHGVCCHTHAHGLSAVAKVRTIHLSENSGKVLEQFACRVRRRCCAGGAQSHYLQVAHGAGQRSRPTGLHNSLACYWRRRPVILLAGPAPKVSKRISFCPMVTDAGAATKQSRRNRCQGSCA